MFSKNSPVSWISKRSAIYPMLILEARLVITWWIPSRLGSLSGSDFNISSSSFSLAFKYSTFYFVSLDGVYLTFLSRSNRSFLFISYLYKSILMNFLISALAPEYNSIISFTCVSFSFWFRLSWIFSIRALVPFAPCPPKITSSCTKSSNPELSSSSFAYLYLSVFNLSDIPSICTFSFSIIPPYPFSSSSALDPQMARKFSISPSSPSIVPMYLVFLLWAS